MAWNCWRYDGETIRAHGYLGGFNVGFCISPAWFFDNLQHGAADYTQNILTAHASNVGNRLAILKTRFSFTQILLLPNHVVVKASHLIAVNSISWLLEDSPCAYVYNIFAMTQFTDFLTWTAKKTFFKNSSFIFSLDLPFCHSGTDQIKHFLNRVWWHCHFWMFFWGTIFLSFQIWKLIWQIWTVIYTR